MSNKDILAPTFTEEQVAAIEEVLRRYELKNNAEFAAIYDRIVYLAGKLSGVQQPAIRQQDKLQVALEEIIKEDAPDMAKRLMNTIALHFNESNSIKQKFAYLSQIL